MADARFRNWHRAGPSAIALTALIAAMSSPGCGDNNTNSGGGGSGGTTSTTTPTGGTGGTGGSTGGSTGGTTGGTGGTEPLGPPKVEAVAATNAIDSTPDSGATTIYFTGATAADGAGVFQVPFAGGAVTKVFAGDPFTAPLGITITNDDKTLIVADPGVEANPADPKTPLGALLKLGTNGNTPTVLNGSAGTKPRGVDIGDDAGEETIFFTGEDPSDGLKGLFKTPVAGGAFKAVAKGPPFVDPSGVAVGKTQTFVVDTNANAGGAAHKLGNIIVIQNGTASVFIPNIGVGYPSGVSLSTDEKTLVVSGIDPDTGSDAVLVIDIGSKMITPYSGMGVDKNRDAGGLHRARKSDDFSWADLAAGGTGTVYKVTFK